MVDVMRPFSRVAASVPVLVLLGACAGDPVAPKGETAVVRIAVSESTLPVMRRLADEARQVMPDLTFEFLPPMHSAGAVAATHLGDADVGVVSRSLTDEEAAFGLRYIHVARDPLLFAAHRDAGVDGLTSSQLQAIYEGAIEDWGPVGGSAGPITVLDREEHTSPKRALRAALLGDVPITSRAIVLERPGMMTDSLASIDGAIGYTTLAQVLAAGTDASILAVDGVAPTAANVVAGRYRWSVPIGVVLPATPSRAAMRFVEFLTGEACRAAMEGCGYVPFLVSLVIGTVPEQEVLHQEERFRPLIDHVSAELGPHTEVRLRHFASYEDVVREFLAGNVNAAFLGSYTYVLAHDEVAVEPIARPEVDGVSTYRGLLLAARDGGVRNWRDLRGSSISMVPDTTAADLFPRLYLKRNGIDRLESFVGTISWAGSHEASVRKLLAGEVQAAAVKDRVYREMVEIDPTIADRVFVLAEGREVPENTLVVRRDVDVACFGCHGRAGQSDAGRGLDVVEVLRDELLGLEREPDGRAILAALGADRFVVTGHEDYAAVEEMLMELAGSTVVADGGGR